MTLDPAFDTPFYDAGTDLDAAVREHAEMLEVWTTGRRLAATTAQACQAFGDELAARIASLDVLMPALPDSDPAEWYERVTPVTDVSPAALDKRLRRTMRDLYAIAGAYRRAEVELADALRNNAAPPVVDVHLPQFPEDGAE